MHARIMEMGRVAALASYRDMELNGIVIVIVTCKCIYGLVSNEACKKQ